jgi:competence protein ComEA
MVGESRGTVVMWVVAAVLGVVALLRLTGSADEGAAGEPVRVERQPGGAQTATGAGGGANGAGGAATGRARRGRSGLYVHVAGAVRRPGLVQVPAGARVAAAVTRAGGPSRKADLAGVNLAAQVEDGQQVVVPAAGAVPGAAGPAGAVTAPGVKASLGTATVEQLDEIDGIGPTLAERIVEHRTEKGGFGSLDELQDVDGIGEKRFETLREALQP